MALWLTRSGRFGEHESKFLEDSRVYLTWDNLETDLSKCKSRGEIREVLVRTYPEANLKTLIIYSGQLWMFAHKMSEGDWVVCPSKRSPSIHVGEIIGSYAYNPKNQHPYRHYRDVKWIKKDIPRITFDQDILFSFGSAMTICAIERNDAEKRVRSLEENHWRRQSPSPSPIPAGEVELTDRGNQLVDLDRISRDQIARLILARFKGKSLERLVGAVLEAQGYSTYQSPQGADGGVDLLASPGPLGFGHPRICVQVKSEEGPISRVVLDQLIGVMSKVQADHGLLVAWGGFKSSFDKEIATQFFRVRLWDQDDLINQIFANYNNLDADIRAELPLKQIWVIALADPEVENQE